MIQFSCRIKNPVQTGQSKQCRYRSDATECLSGTTTGCQMDLLDRENEANIFIQHYVNKFSHPSMFSSIDIFLKYKFFNPLKTGDP